MNKVYIISFLLLIVGLFVIQRTIVETVTNYAPRHFLNSFNGPSSSQTYAHINEGFESGSADPNAEQDAVYYDDGDGDEPEPEPEPEEPETDVTTKCEKNGVNNINIRIYNNSGSVRPRRPGVPPPPPPPPPPSAGGPWGHMPHYEAIATGPAKPVDRMGYNYVFPPKVPITPYNPPEIEPAKCPVCPLNDNQPWAEYRTLEDDVPPPY